MSVKLARYWKLTGATLGALVFASSLAYAQPEHTGPVFWACTVNDSAPDRPWNLGVYFLVFEADVKNTGLVQKEEAKFKAWVKANFKPKGEFFFGSGCFYRPKGRSTFNGGPTNYNTVDDLLNDKREIAAAASLNPNGGAYIIKVRKNAKGFSNAE